MENKTKKIQELQYPATGYYSVKSKLMDSDVWLYRELFARSKSDAFKIFLIRFKKFGFEFTNIFDSEILLLCEKKKISEYAMIQTPKYKKTKYGHKRINN